MTKLKGIDISGVERLSVTRLLRRLHEVYKPMKYTPLNSIEEIMYHSGKMEILDFIEKWEQSERTRIPMS